MPVSSLSFSEDLSATTVVAVVLLCLLSLGLLVWELLKRERFALSIFASGLLATMALAFAVLRPNRVTARDSLIGPRIVVLMDASRRLLLPSESGKTRQELGLSAIERLRRHWKEARFSVFGFGDSEPRPLSDEGMGSGRLSKRSDLLKALEHLDSNPGERPSAVVVVSDGRLERPGEDLSSSGLEQLLDRIKVPIHTVRLSERAPADASIRAVRAAGAAVAHQPLRIKVDVGCSGGLECSEVPVTVRELRQKMPPFDLAHGVAEMVDGQGSVELTVTLERGGSRVVEVVIDPPSGDSIANNDSRILNFVVTRERVRLLHVAGRPTYDVRALRMWLKADESIDLVAFFILRTESDQTNTSSDSELALIPFPVDELFSQHLPSFDAIILQDIDAVTYGLQRYLAAIRAYVEAGGGVIMVGGPASFGGGRYGGTELEDVLPIELPVSGEPFSADRFTPTYTQAGQSAAVLRPLRALLGERLPEMPGANMLAAPRENAIVLWEHSRLSAGGQKMPVLALGETGDGRSIALGLDGTHLLSFSELAAEAAGRAYGALWEGLLGWLMRDPRYEIARIELLDECIVGEPTTLRVVPIPGASGKLSLELSQLGLKGETLQRDLGMQQRAEPVEVVFEDLDEGGYTARARLGKAPPTRFDFACESGGEAFSDPRPDPDRLKKIAANGGKSVTAEDVDELAEPEATRVTEERSASPLLPAWVWALSAATLLGVHWVLRRRGGLA